MLRLFSATMIGIVFGTGIVVSGMANPAKVLNFFDVFGKWDPSLLLVMAAALSVTFLGYRVALRRPAPLFDLRFHLPARRDIDVPLVAGSAVFGIGWGIAGFCPGGAIPALGSGQASAILFVVALIGGILIANGIKALSRHSHASAR